MTPSKTNMRYRNSGSHALDSLDSPIPSAEIQHAPAIPAYPVLFPMIGWFNLVHVPSWWSTAPGPGLGEQVIESLRPGADSCSSEHSLLSLVKGVSLGAETGRSARALEVSAEGRSKERSENDLSAAESGQSEPQQEDELEDKVEGEPVNNAEEALDDGEEGENNPVRQPLGVIFFGLGEEGGERVVAGNDKSSKVCEELATNVEDDEEEVESSNTDDGIGLGNANLLLEIVQGGVFGELLINDAQVVLSLCLSRRHCALR